MALWGFLVLILKTQKKIITPFSFEFTMINEFYSTRLFECFIKKCDSFFFNKMYREH